MKKVILILALLVINLFISTPVYAASDHSLIYDIEKFQVTADTITFEGWAFILNYHNNGGNGTTISISANNELEKEAVYNSSKDNSLYEANCIRYTGSNRCVESHDAATCSESVSASSCRYDNVGFKITFSISELLRKFGSDKTITFKLKVTTNGVTKSTDIAVSSEVSNVQNGDVIQGDETKITISDVSSTASIRVSKGRVLTSSGRFSWGSKFYWAVNESFTIVDTIPSGKFPGLKMYALQYTKGTTTACEDIHTPGANGCVVGKAYPGSTETGWAYASWLKVDGSVKIILGEADEDQSCPREYNNTDDNLYCDTNGTYEQVVIETMSGNDLKDSITEGESDHSIYYKNLDKIREDGVECTHTLKRTVETKACITQKGFATFNISDAGAYSGGGFYFSADYNGSATYELCGDQNNRKSGYQVIKVTVIEKYARDYCTTGSKLDTDTCYKRHYTREACGTNEDGSTKYCRVYSHTTYHTRKHTCSDSSSVEYYNSYEDATDDEQKLISRHMKNLLGKPDHNAATYSLDSNKVDKENTLVEIGQWGYPDEETKNKIEAAFDDTHWEPGEEIPYELEFKLERACINRQTANVRYTRGSCTSNEVDGGKLYYIPLKQGMEDGYGEFPVKVSIDDVNVLEDKTWSIDYECDANCDQNLYNPDGSFKFIYRPISLNNPFPGRTPGDNWKPFMSDFNAGVTRAKSKMTRNEPEYEINLTPSNIASIKSYNRNKVYTDLSTITNTGRSNYLNELGITNLVRSTYFEELGECSSRYCWPTNSLFDEGW